MDWFQWLWALLSVPAGEGRDRTDRGAVAWRLAGGLGAGLLLAVAGGIITPDTVIYYCDDLSWWCRLFFLCDCFPEGMP